MEVAWYASDRDLTGGGDVRKIGHTLRSCNLREVLHRRRRRAPGVRADVNSASSSIYDYYPFSLLSRKRLNIRL